MNSASPHSDGSPPVPSPSAARGPFLSALKGHVADRPPLWLMRQAGRYLPEYRALRATAPSFLDFCYTPTLAAEATLQPIRRFGFDAAILFSDILVVPDALGQVVSFEAGHGPRLAPLAGAQDIAGLRDEVDMARLAPVFETVERVKGDLPSSTDLIGFCGAPWTVASYMVAGQGTPDQAPARLFAYRHPDLFQTLIDRLVAASIDYLAAQAKAGVDAVQIFDSWAGVLPTLEYERWCLAPVRAIAVELARRHAAYRTWRSPSVALPSRKKRPAPASTSEAQNSLQIARPCSVRCRPHVPALLSGPESLCGFVPHGTMRHVARH